MPSQKAKEQLKALPQKFQTFIYWQWYNVRKRCEKEFHEFPERKTWRAFQVADQKLREIQETIGYKPY